MSASQPNRATGDGAVSVSHLEGGRLHLSVVTDGKTQDIVLSSFNAWRVFGLLAHMLGIELSAKLRKSIQLVD